MRRKTLKEKLLAVFLAVAVAVTMIPGGFALFAKDADAATTITLTGKKFEYKDDHGDWHTTTNFSGGGYDGICAAAHRHSYTGSHKYTVHATGSYDSGDAFRTLAWFAQNGYKNPSTGKAWYPNSNRTRALLSRTLNYYSTDKVTKDRGKAFNFTASNIKEMMSRANAYKAKYPIQPGFECYYIIPTGDTAKQAGIIWKYTPWSKVTLQKASSVTGYKKSFAGIKYTVYKSNKSTKVGVLEVNANGKPKNTLTLEPGSYYYKETSSLSDNPYYKVDPEWHSVTLKSGQSRTISATDTAEGKFTLQKSFTPDSDDGYTLGGFKFILTRKADGKKYNGITDANGTLTIDGIQAGDYTVSEELTSAQLKAGYKNSTKQAQPITIENGKNNTLPSAWKNTYLKGNYLQIIKTTTDGGPVDGFQFDVSGDLDPRVLTKESFTAYAHITPKTTKEGFTLGDFVVNEEELADLNEAAANKETGTSTVHVTATATKPAEQVTGKEISEFKNGDNYVFAEGDAVTYEGDVYIAQTEGTYTEEQIQDTPDNPTVFSDETKFKKAEQGEDETETISIPVKVTLKSVKEKQEGEDPTTPNSIDEPEGWEFDYNDITWAGSADTYHKCDEETVTDEAGTVLIKKLLPGTYTVKEMLTEAQQKRYITPEPQTKEMGEAANGVEPEPMIFEMTNEDKPVPVVLKKTNAKEGGVVDGFEFTLTGKRGYDDADIDVSGVTKDGSIEFGNLYTGEYILEETSFDPEIYMFHKKFKLKGHDKPAIAISLVTDDDGNWTADLSTGEKLSGKKGDTLEIGFENDPITNLLITKVDTDTRLFLEDAEFDLYEGDKKTASFRLVLGEEGRAAAEIFWKDEDSTIFTDNQPIPDDGAEMPEPSVVDENTPDNGSNTSSSNNASNSDGNVTTMADTTEPADGGNDTAGDGSGDSEAGTTEDVQYNYAILKGLKRHTEYRIVETKNPKGHTGDIDYGFTFEEDMEPLIFENKQPEISTTATDSKTDQHMSNATEGPVTIIDTVEYKDLTPDKEYTMTARLILKPQTQEDVDTSSEDFKTVVADGKTVEKTIKFTPKEKDGSVDVPLTFNAEDLEGARTVVFESLGDPTLEEENSIIATHAEVDNEEQSIYFPEVHTSAKGEDTQMNITGADEETTIIDTVEYSNVIAGKVYEMKGVLMSKETGKPITVDGEKVTASVQFKATEDSPDYSDLTEDEPAEGEEAEVKLVSGSVELEFTFDSTEYAGDSMVVFEELYSEGKLVGQHKNIEDKKQTVRIPIIGTKASAGRNVIKDKVAYKNLIPGKRYIMRGVMMNKKTGEPMVVDGEELTAELEFTPKKANGIVTLTFDVNTKKLKGKTLVAFEKCYVITDESGEEVEIAAHENLDSKAQTVTFRSPQTGQVLPWFIFAALAAMLASAGYMLRKKFLLK